MSDADKLFEELGYKKSESNNEVNYVKETGGLFKRISFDLRLKQVSVSYDYDLPACIELQELKAINKKCEELGWNE